MIYSIDWNMQEDQLALLENLDKLEEIFLDGNRIPFSGNRLVNEQDATDLLDEIRESIPSEIRTAASLRSIYSPLFSEKNIPNLETCSF